MAQIRIIPTGEVRRLDGFFTFGRAPTNSLIVGAGFEDVSRQHGRLTWGPDGWNLRDLGSRAGTFVDGRPARAGRDLPIRSGQTVTLAGLELFTLLTDDPPVSFARHDGTGEEQAEADDGTIDLPLIGRLRRDLEQGWLLDRGYGPEPLRGELPGWTLCTPKSSLETANLRSLGDATLRIGVPDDLFDPISLRLVFPDSEVDLGRYQAFFVLFILAREQRRRADGWVELDRLERLCNFDRRIFDTNVFRVRERLEGAGIEGFRGIVEVTRGKRRLGVPPERVLEHPLR